MTTPGQQGGGERVARVRRLCQTTWRTPASGADGISINGIGRDGINFLQDLRRCRKIPQNEHGASGVRRRRTVSRRPMDSRPSSEERGATHREQHYRRMVGRLRSCLLLLRPPPRMQESQEDEEASSRLMHYCARELPRRRSNNACNDIGRQTRWR